MCDEVSGSQHVKYIVDIGRPGSDVGHYRQAGDCGGLESQAKGLQAHFAGGKTVEPALDADNEITVLLCRGRAPPGVAQVPPAGFTRVRHEPDSTDIDKSARLQRGEPGTKPAQRGDVVGAG